MLVWNPENASAVVFDFHIYRKAATKPHGLCFFPGSQNTPKNGMCILANEPRMDLMPAISEIEDLGFRFSIFGCGPDKGKTIWVLKVLLERNGGPTLKNRFGADFDNAVIWNCFAKGSWTTNVWQNPLEPGFSYRFVCDGRRPKGF